MVIFTIGHSLPFPQNDVEQNSDSTLDKKNSNVTSEKHSLNEDHSSIPNPGPGCTIEYKTYYEILEEESTRRECHTVIEQECTTRTREKCIPWTDNVCTTKYRQKCRNWTEKKCTDSWRDECSQKTKEECNDSTRPVQVPYEEDECVTRQEKRCEKHWEEPSPGKKVWVDNPATCKFYDATECNPVTKYRTEQEKYTKCDQIPYQHCDRIKDTNCVDVPQQKCEDEPWEDCQDVQKQRCEPETWDDCQDIPRQICEDIHSKIPRQATKQVPIRVCGNHREVYNVEANFKKSSDLEEDIDDKNQSENEAENKQQDEQKELVENEITDTKIGPKALFYSDSKADTRLEDENVSFVFGDK